MSEKITKDQIRQAMTLDMPYSQLRQRLDFSAAVHDATQRAANALEGKVGPEALPEIRRLAEAVLRVPNGDAHLVARATQAVIRQEKNVALAKDPLLVLREIRDQILDILPSRPGTPRNTAA